VQSIGQQIHFHGYQGIAGHAHDTQRDEIQYNKKTKHGDRLQVLFTVHPGQWFILPDNRQQLGSSKIPQHKNKNGHDRANEHGLSKNVIGIPVIFLPQVAQNND